MRDRGIGSGGALQWLNQRISGIVLTPILLAHLLTMHRYHEHGLAWNDVIALFNKPYWRVLEVSFLVIALYHAVNGAYSVVQDYVKKPGARLTIFGALVVLAVALLAFGLVTVFSIKQPV